MAEDNSLKLENPKDSLSKESAKTLDLIQTKFPKWDEWDKKKTSAIYEKYEGSWVRKWALYTSFFGDPKLWIPTLIITGVYGLIIHDLSLLVIFLAGFLQSYLIYWLIKHKIVKRQRPFKQHEHIKRLDKTGYGYSFPSGHVHHSTILLGLIWLQFYPEPWFIVIMILYNGIIGYSRLVSGIHYIIDTYCGAIEGYLALFFFWYVTKDLYIYIYEYFAQFISFL